MLTGIKRMLRGPVVRDPSRTGFCPACCRWVLLDDVWGCRFCRADFR
jgi:hypothetical protein